MTATLLHDVRDAAAVVVLSVIVALGFNGLRHRGIPLVAQHEYEILVPCPDTVGEVDELEASSLHPGAVGELVIDGRKAADFAAWSYPGATSVPFDYLDPTPAETVRRIVSSGARRVVVYGDGGEPDSGRELARELAGRGIRNVAFVRGGAKTLRLAFTGDAR